MQKRIIFSSVLVLLVMSENMIGMQILKKISCNKPYPVPSIMRIFNKAYYNEPASNSDLYTIAMIQQSYIEIAQSEHKIERLEDIGIHDLKDQKTIKRYFEIRMHKELMDKNKSALRKHLDAFCKPQKTVPSIE